LPSLPPAGGRHRLLDERIISVRGREQEVPIVVAEIGQRRYRLQRDSLDLAVSVETEADVRRFDGLVLEARVQFFARGFSPATYPGSRRTDSARLKLVRDTNRLGSSSLGKRLFHMPRVGLG
jgi:hypothetical protein